METHHDPNEPFFMNSDPDWSDDSSYYLDFRPRTRGKAIRQSPTAYRLPVEVYSEIFLYTVQADPHSQTKLTHVCRHWYDIMLSTPGIHSQLRIYNWTDRKVVERVGRWWLLDVTVDFDDEKDSMYTAGNFDPVEFHATFMAAAEAASRWRSLTLLLLPPPGEYEDLQIIHPLQHLESFKLAANCDLGNFLEPLLNAITTTITPRFTVLEVFQPDAALHLLQPTHIQFFSSITTLRIMCKRMQNPVDVLPCLHQLEIFEAHHILLPIYPPGVNLPLTLTLRVLHLKSVSVQWMAGQLFPILEECSIMFPHHANAIQSVYMPSCSILKYDNNDLGALEQFHISHLNKLEIKCGQWRPWRGTLQLVSLHPIFAAQSLTCLHLEIKCSERLLANMLRLVPTLEELWMRLSGPHALSSAFFLAFAVRGRIASAGPSSQTIAPLGRKLRMLRLHYKRWLRSSERNALIPAFGAIVASHPPEEKNFSFQFSFGEGLNFQQWNIHEPVERLDIWFGFEKTAIGVSSPDGIVPLSRVDNGGLVEPKGMLGYLPLPRDSEYITTKVSWVLPIDFLFSVHGLKEGKLGGLRLIMEPDTIFSLDAPLFHTLKVLNVWSISSSFLAGKTFHKLERYKEEWIFDEHMPGQGSLTEMPVCTRLAVPLRRLATLKLPQIRELGVWSDGEHHRIWEKHISVLANLSGLTLLHLRHAHPTWPTIAVIKILESLPALETLITGDRFLTVPHVHFFEAFVPMNVPAPSGLDQSNVEGQISGVLCPRLYSVQIEGIGLTEQAELVPVLRDIISRRAIIGFPLKSFTFYFDPYSGTPQMWQLVGEDKCFMMEDVPVKKFQFDI